jgi:uracil phosphoribosyltransferase
MVTSSPQAVVRSTGIAPQTRVVTVGIARAGTIPSQIVYDLLSDLLDPSCVRQDHLFMSRAADARGHVIGATWHDAKIGRDVEGRTVLFPDPMAATGSSLVSALDHYMTRLEGVPGRCIAMHLILTPEYLRHVLDKHPNTLVYAFRLDRGMSEKDVLATVPGRAGPTSVGSTTISTSSPEPAASARSSTTPGSEDHQSIAFAGSRAMSSRTRGQRRFTMVR